MTRSRRRPGRRLRRSTTCASRGRTRRRSCLTVRVWWGAGTGGETGGFAVSRHFDAKGRVVRVRVELGTEERQRLLRRMQLRQRGAIVTRAILDDGEPIRFAERMKPSNAHDSGWAFSSGVEDAAYMKKASNLVVVSLRSLLGQCEELEAILDAPVGAVFRREGDGFIPDM